MADSFRAGGGGGGGACPSLLTNISLFIMSKGQSLIYCIIHISPPHPFEILDPPFLCQLLLGKQMRAVNFTLKDMHSLIVYVLPVTSCSTLCSST